MTSMDPSTDAVVFLSDSFDAEIPTHKIKNTGQQSDETLIMVRTVIIITSLHHHHRITIITHHPLLLSNR